MARQAATLAGAFIGAALGAPQLGFFIGSLVGNAIDPVRIKAPSIGDIAQQTSAEGVACPLYAGTAGGAGNLVYASEPDIVDGGTSSGKGGPEVENPDRAYITFIIRIGASLFDGPGYRLGITGLRKVWEDEKLVYDVSPESTILEESAKYAEGFSFYPGDHTQLPDPDVEAIEGVGNVPAYRGRAIFVKKRHDMTDRKSIPGYRFEVTVNGAEYVPVSLATDIKSYAGTPGAMTLGPSLGLLSNTNIVRLSPSGIYAAAAGPSESVWRRFDVSTQAWIDLSALPGLEAGTQIQNLAWSPDNRYLAGTIDRSPLLVVWKRTGDSLDLLPAASEIPAVSAAARGLAWDSVGARIAFSVAASDESIYLYDFAGDVLSNLVGLPSPGTNFIGGAPRRLEFQSGAGSRYLLCGNPTNTFIVRCTEDPLEVAVSVSTGGNAGVFFDASGGYVVAVNAGAVYVYEFVESLVDGEQLNLESTYTTDIPANVFDAAISADRRYLAIAASAGSPLPYPVIVALSAATPPVCSAVSNPADTGDSVQAVSWTGMPIIGQLESGTTTVEQVVLATGRRCKIPDSTWNLPGLNAKVIRGTVAASQGYTAQDFLNALRVLYPCDGSCHDGKIHILLRGGAVDVELDEQFMVDEDSDLEQEEVLRNGDDKRLAPLRRPARLNVMFPNANVGYTLTKATPPNYGDRGDAVGETSIQVPAVLDEETEAPQLADILDKVGRADAEGEFVRVFPEYLAAKLVTGSVVRLTGGDLVRRMRVESLRRGDGTVRMGLRIDRTHALTSQATAQPSPGWPAPPPSLAGETTFALLNIPGGVDEDDRIGLRFGVCGQPGSAWHGARVDYRIAGDTEWTSLGDFTTRAVMGSLSADLPAFSPYYTDYWHTLQVHLIDDDDLVAVSTAQLLRGGNAAAIVFPDNTAEILQFQTPVEGSPREWSLTTLPRGRLATTPGPHSAGARFVMLDGTRFVALPSSLIGKALQFRVTSLGNSPETAPIYDFTWTPAHCQREFAPERLELTRAGGTISGTWAARKRFGTDVAPIHSGYFRGYRVTLTDGVTTTVLPDTNDTQFSASDAAFTGDITVTVQGVNLITGAGPGTSETI